ncbi:hypothetical protein FXO37_27628 [Capsicum annuum]|nr:hypothetical protein FXO37_27628 [Capsicum annuum]
MNNPNREWMYDRLLEDGFINPRFIDGVKIFVEFAKSHPECMDDEKLRCPCNHRKCRNKNILDEFTVMTHLENNGFVPNSYRWHHHGESYIPASHLQRLYAFDATAKHMRWHSKHERDGVIRHLLDSPAWKQFDQAHPSFASENESTKKYPKACYILDDKAKEFLCKWLQELRFSDGYVSNLGRCIDMNKLKHFGMKSHDCHVFMQWNLRRYKNDVKNKNNVETSICNTYLVEEASLFCAHYFKSHIPTRHRKVPQNLDDGGVEQDDPEMVSVLVEALPHTLNDPAFQEDDSQIHEIDIDKNEILTTLNDPYGMFIDMEEGDEEKEKDEGEDEGEGEGEGKGEDEDGDENEDEDRDGDKNNDDDDEDEEEEEDVEEEEENMSDTPSLVVGSPDTPGFIDIPIGSSSSSLTTRRLVVSVVREKGNPVIMAICNTLYVSKLGGQ